MNGDTLDRVLADQSLWPSPETSESAVVKATRECAPLFLDVAKCYALLGGDSAKCHLKYVNAHGCLGSFLQPEKLEALRECVASKDGELGNCVAEANALKKANDDTMDRYAKEELKFTAAEENAWENCGSLAFATSEDHANLTVYCSMQAACPQEFSSWMTCLGKNDNDVHKCRTETRALLQGFRVYLEKSYIRDPTFFMRLDMKFEKDHF